jgi:hypothetical protein
MNADRHDEAETVLRRTVEALLEDQGSVDGLANFIAISRTSLSKCLLAQGRFDESEQLVWLVLGDLSSRPDLKSTSEAAQAQLQAIARAQSEAAIQ